MVSWFQRNYLFACIIRGDVGPMNQRCKSVPLQKFDLILRLLYRDFGSQMDFVTSILKLQQFCCKSVKTFVVVECRSNL